MLSLKNITKRYTVGSFTQTALNGVSLRFRKSEFVSILGPSGCGKTTMLNIIGGLDGYDEGDLVINGTSTKKFKDRDWDAYRNHSIGFVFQSYHLIPHQTVLQNVELALTLSGVPKAERRARAKKALKEVGLGDHINKRPTEMSGGQMQRVAIARALINNPDIILADEPTGALDTETSVQVMEILKKVSEDRLVIMVTHNPELAEQYSTRIVRMLDGKILGDTNPLTDEEIKANEARIDALEAETSVQVMEALKTASKDRFVVMVMHDPNSDKQQSTSVLRMHNGSMVADTKKLTKNEIRANKAAMKLAKKVGKTKKKAKKPSMSLFTSFMLSLKNLFTKKGRTTLTAFAGSIGIIGIALILAISQGMTTYINDVQESTLASYPLTLESSTVELSSLMQTFMNVQSEDVEHKTDKVYEKSALYDILNAVNNIDEVENDLKSFNEFLLDEMKEEDSELSEAINGIQYTYDLDLLIYTENVDGSIIRCDTKKILQDLIMQYMDMDMSAMTSMAESSPMASLAQSSPMASMGGGMAAGLWQELLPGTDGAPINDLITEQYEVVHGSWPNSYDEIVLVLDENNELDDVTLYALGLLPEENMDALANAALDGAEVEHQDLNWSYEEICDLEYKTILNADCYSYDALTDTYTDLRDTDAGLRYLYDNALSLKVTGIVRPVEGSDATILSGTICYTRDLTEYLIEEAKDSAVIEAQLADKERDVLTGLPFDSTTGTLTDAEKEDAFRAYIEDMTDAEKAAAYIAINAIPTEEFLQQQVDAVMGSMTREEMETMMIDGLGSQMNVSGEELEKYFASMDDEEFDEMFTQLITERAKAQYAASVTAQMSAMAPQQLLMAFDMALPNYTTEQCALYYDEIVKFSESTYDDNLLLMGYIDLEKPASINIYASSFENKDRITEAIGDYNDTVEELKQIKYTDYLGLMMSSITLIINAITYVLIAFVAISLVVSSIMIGVITLISVQERTKEIGILRAIGASKKNVSRLFNAETIIIGFAAGLIGVGVTYLLCIPINAILFALTGIANLEAILPIEAAVILVAISVVLTLFSGIIPSRSAAKKDPVVALRTE